MRITEVSSADEAKVVDLICEQWDKHAERITSEASWSRLTQFFYDELCYEFYEQRTRWLRNVNIVKWTEAGHPAADRAIRRFARDMAERSRFDEMLVSIRSYFLKTAEQPFIPFPRGRHIVQHLMRDIWIPALAEWVAKGTGVELTRSGGNPTPSAAYFISRACKRKGIKLKEQEANRIIWRLSKLPAALEASMPEIPQ
jgi:hypothetical protein